MSSDPGSAPPETAAQGAPERADRPPAQGDHRPLLREYLEALLIAIIFATFARTYVVQAFKIPSGSMEENLLIGDHILVNKFVYGPASGLERTLLPERRVRRGDVVVFKYPKDPARDFIKRCVGLPGDRIEIVDKVLFVNGRRVDDASYTYHTDPIVYPRLPEGVAAVHHIDNFGPYTVPAASYFCMGDNRDNSNDSRYWGPVPAAYVKGRALLVYWSFAGAGELPPTTWLGRLEQLGRVVRHFFGGTRWSRTLRIVR
jgi:signal peptidase I